MKRKLTIMLICLVFMIGLLPISAQAAEIIDSQKCGDNVTWTLDANYVMTISGEGDMYDYEGFMTEWHIETVIIEDGVTSIGDYSFWGRSGITSVSIPDSVTRIGECAFGYCEELTEITIPAGVTSVGEWAFVDCNKLKEIRFEGDAPEQMSEDIFSISGITILYPEGNSTWSDVKYRWKSYYDWQEYDPDSYIEEDVPDNNMVENAAASAPDSEEEMTEEVVSEEVISDEDPDEVVGTIVFSILSGILKGVFGVVIIGAVGIILYELLKKIKKPKNSESDKEQ